jgi:hypothetical protein
MSKRMKRLKVAMLASIGLIVVLSSSCSPLGSRLNQNNRARLSEDERHRLYAAALAVSESPMDSEIFKDVCRQIGIFDEHGRPNDQYIMFVSQHVNWGVRSESEPFRREIDSKERARDYLKRHLSQ